MEDLVNEGLFPHYSFSRCVWTRTRSEWVQRPIAFMNDAG
jgi:hypothetical protein